MALLEIARILPTVVKFFPELVKSAPAVGKVIPLNSVLEEPDADAMEALQRKVKVKPDKTFNDNSSVIKVSEAIKCVEKTFNDTTILLELGKYVIRQLLEGSKTEFAAERIANGIAKCLRENSLRQDTVRIKGRHPAGYQRPAVG